MTRAGGNGPTSSSKAFCGSGTSGKDLGDDPPPPPDLGRLVGGVNPPISPDLVTLKIQVEPRPHLILGSSSTPCRRAASV